MRTYIQYAGVYKLSNESKSKTCLFFVENCSVLTLYVHKSCL